MAPFQLISAWHQFLKLLQRYLHGINKNYKLYQAEGFSLFGFQLIVFEVHSGRTWVRVDDLRKEKMKLNGPNGLNWTDVLKESGRSYTM